MSCDSYPSYIGIDTINFCNARCPFCPLFQGDAQMDRSIRPATVMPQALFERLLEQIADWKRQPLGLQLNRNAELLQDPLLFDRLAGIKRSGLGGVTTLLSNAQLLGRPASEAILDAGIKDIMIGFDGASKEIYEGHRIRCDYDRVLNNIRQFAKLRDKGQHKTAILIRYVRTPRNDHEVIAAYKMLNEFLNPELDRFYDTLALDWSIGPAAEPSDLYFYPKTESSSKSTRCERLEVDINIHADGKVAACCLDYNLTIAQGGLGDVSQESILDVWHGARLSALRATFVSNTPKDCLGCINLREPEPVPPEWRRFHEDVVEHNFAGGFVCQFVGENPDRKVSV